MLAPSDVKDAAAKRQTPRSSQPGKAVTVACQSFEGAKGGIARVCELTARVAMDVGYMPALLSVQNEGGIFRHTDHWHGHNGSRANFVWACLTAGLKRDRILYDQLGTARAQILPRSLSRPCGTWIHGIEVWYELRPDRLNAARRMSYMVANSNFTREHATSFDPVFAAARVCWLGTAEDDPPGSLAPLDGPPVVTIIGRLDNAAYKGHRELIEAWSSVVDAVPGAELVIIGTGPSLEKHRRLAAESEAAAFIKIAGFEPDTALPERWKKSVIFAMPSRGEGFGLAYIEAMRWGVPVIASVHDAGQEVNLHEVTGLNVNLDRRDELRDAVVTLLRDRDLSARMGAAGHRRWREHFSYGAFRDRFLPELQHFMEL
jgi:phosphatidylinositol alpha-1,6-mannosyltransferase